MPADERTDSTHRRYSERDVAWIAFIKRLKATHMLLGEIQRYAELRQQGEGTEGARMQLFHRSEVSLSLPNTRPTLGAVDITVGGPVVVSHPQPV